jgi:hypothetical protein
MNLPNLFIPGAGKSGTSSLHDYLSQHPEIYMSKIKEPQFFGVNKQYKKGWDWYSKLFEGSENFKVRGESSTGYLTFPQVIERIKESISEPKFIFIFRNPIDRAYSHYWWLRGMGYEDKSFRDAFLFDLDEEPNPDCHIGAGYKYYYQFGCYAKWLSRYYDVFGKDCIHIITSEQLKEKPIETLNSCTEFLSVKPFNSVNKTLSNKTVILKYPRLYQWVIGDSAKGRFIKNLLPKKVREHLRLGKGKMLVASIIKKYLGEKAPYPKLSLTEREWVAGYYQNEVSHLRQMTGLSFGEWKKDFSLVQDIF